MPATQTSYEHIVLNDAGVPMLGGTTMKVVELVVEQRAYGWSAEEFLFQHPYLTLGQIHSALAYYWDHQAELDEEIERRMAQVEALRQRQNPTPLESRLKRQGLL
jgi:uncharacterized protein (DUF433 family)